MIIYGVTITSVRVLCERHFSFVDGAQVRSFGLGWAGTVCWLVWRLLHSVMYDWFHNLRQQ
jgi:hypothetical protein